MHSKDWRATWRRRSSSPCLNPGLGRRGASGPGDARFKIPPNSCSSGCTRRTEVRLGEGEQDHPVDIQDLTEVVQVAQVAWGAKLLSTLIWVDALGRLKVGPEKRIKFILLISRPWRRWRDDRSAAAQLPAPVCLGEGCHYPPSHPHRQGRPIFFY